MNWSKKFLEYLKNHKIDPRTGLYQHENHKKPVTRREFLAQSAFASIGTVMVPSLFSMLASKQAFGQTSCPPLTLSKSTMIPFLQLDLAGGAPLGEGVCIGGMGGQTDLLQASDSLPNPYEKFGLSNDIAYHTLGVGGLNTEYGLRFHPTGGFFLGLNKTIESIVTSPSARADFKKAIDGFVIPALTFDDTGNNEMSALHLPYLVGRTGILSPTISRFSRPGGGRHKPAGFYNLPQGTPVMVTSGVSAQGLGGYPALANAFANAFDGNTEKGEARAKKVLTAIKNMSQSKLDTFTNMSLDSQLKELIKCGYLDATILPLLYQPETIYPTEDPGSGPMKPIYDALVSVYGDRSNNLVAAIAATVLRGFAGAGNLVLGGYDNHDGTAVNARTRAYNAGKVVGEWLCLARALNEPVFISITTDGAMNNRRGVGDVDDTGVSTDNPAGGGGRFIWPGDGGDKSVQMVLAYIPGAVRGSMVQNPGRQIGAVGPNGIDREYLVTATNQTNVAKAIIFNYLALHGMESMISKVDEDGVNPFDGDEDKYLVFKEPPFRKLP